MFLSRVPPWLAAAELAGPGILAASGKNPLAGCREGIAANLQIYTNVPYPILVGLDRSGILLGRRASRSTLRFPIHSIAAMEKLEGKLEKAKP